MSEQGQFPGMEEPKASGISGGADVINNSGLKQTSQTLVTIKSNIEQIRQAISQLGTQGEQSVKKLTAALDELKTKSAAVGQGMGGGQQQAAPGGGMTAGKGLGGDPHQPPLPGQQGAPGAAPGATEAPPGAGQGQGGVQGQGQGRGNGGDVTFSGRALGIGLAAYGVGAMGRQAGGMLGDAMSAQQTGAYLGASAGLSPNQAMGRMFPPGMSGFTSVQDLNQSYMNTLQSGQAFGSPGYRQQMGQAAGMAMLFPGSGMGQWTDQYKSGGGGFYSPEVTNMMRRLPNAGGVLPYQPGGAPTPLPQILGGLNQQMFGAGVPTVRQANAAQNPGTRQQLMLRQMGLSPENIQGLNQYNVLQAQWAEKNPGKAIPDVFQTDDKRRNAAVTALTGGDPAKQAQLRSFAQQTSAQSTAFEGMDKASTEFSKAVGGFSDAVRNFVQATGSGGALGTAGFAAAKGGGLLAGGTALAGSFGQSYLTARMMKGMMPGGGGAEASGAGGFLKNIFFGGRPGGGLSGSRTPGISNEANLAEGGGGLFRGLLGRGGGALGAASKVAGPVAAGLSIAAIENKLIQGLRNMDPKKGAPQRAGHTAGSVASGFLDYGPLGWATGGGAFVSHIPGLKSFGDAYRPSHIFKDVENLFGDSGMAPAPTFGSRTGDSTDASKTKGKQQTHQVNWRPGGRSTVSALEELARSVGIPMQITASTKSADTDSYHPSSNAIDIGSHGGPKDRATLLRLNQQLAKKFGPGLAEMIYDAPGAVQIRDGKVVGAATYGNKVMRQHKDHIHIAATETSLKAAGINLQGRQARKTTQSGSRTQQPTNPQQGQQQGGGAPAAGPVGSINSPTDFAHALLKALGDPDTPDNVNAIVAWANAEGGFVHKNPLNTTQGAPGATTWNSVGVKTYPDWQTAVNATVQTLNNGHYGNILAALKAGNNAQAVASAVGSSPWGTGHFSVAGGGGGAPAPATGNAGGSTTQGPAQTASTTNKGTEAASLQNINRLTEGGSITESSILASGFTNMKKPPKSTTAPGKAAGQQQGAGGGAPAPGNLIHASPEAAKAYAQQVAKQRGWNFADWDFVAMAESGWRWNAANPSGAYGIPQALPGGKMASAGADWKDNAGTQINWMADYMQQRWGGASGAAAQERSAHWYHGGTWEVAQDSLAMIKKGEMVIPPGAAAMVRDQTPQVTAGRASRGDVHLHFGANSVQVNVASAGDADMREAAQKFVRFTQEQMQEHDLMRN